MKNIKKGFTLIELLVVIAIIGILSGVVLASLNTARQKARNSQRIADVRQVVLALELYYDAQNPNAYPAADPDNHVPDVLFPPGGSLLPLEPLESVSTQAIYKYTKTGSTYCFGVDLEAGTAVPRNNVPACVTSLNTISPATTDYAVAP